MTNGQMDRQTDLQSYSSSYYCDWKSDKIFIILLQVYPSKPKHKSEYQTPILVPIEVTHYGVFRHESDSS